MPQNSFDRQQLEDACIAISKVMRELLQKRKINAQEFLSIVGHMPVKPAEFDIDRWKV
jgi:hypothetical protein